MNRGLMAGLALLGVLVFQGKPALAFAPVDQNGLKARLEAWNSEQDFSGGISYSGVVFAEDYYQDFFDKDWFPLVRFSSEWAPVENLYLGWSLGGMFESGKAIGLLTGEQSEVAVEFYVFPVQLYLRYRFKFVDNQAVVPSIWGGYDYWRFQERVEDGDDTDGDKTGWHWGADLAFLLDLAEPVTAARMKRDFGITDTYLYLAYEHMEVGRGEDGFDFSGEVYSVGLRFDLEGR